MHEKHEGKNLYMSDYMQALYYNVIFVLHKRIKTSLHIWDMLKVNVNESNIF